MSRAPLVVALLVALSSAGCDGGEHEAVEGRVTELERRLDAEIELADAVARLRQLHEVATATAVLDLVDLQGLVVRLSAKQDARPHDLTSVEGAARALKNADWPDYLLTEAENAAEALDALAEALRGRDAEAARRLAPPALAFQLEMRRATKRWFDAVEPWTRRTAPGHGGDHSHE